MTVTELLFMDESYQLLAKDHPTIGRDMQECIDKFIASLNNIAAQGDIKGKTAQAIESLSLQMESKLKTELQSITADLGTNSTTFHTAMVAADVFTYEPTSITRSHLEIITPYLPK
jgi:hypothetical protein